METQQKGKALYVVLALAFVALIAGGATWFYVMGNKSSSDTAATQTSNDGLAAATTTELNASAKTELDGSLTDLDNELAALQLDEGSDDDTINF